MPIAASAVACETGAYVMVGGLVAGESWALPVILSATWPMLLRRVPEATASCMVVPTSEAGGTKTTPAGSICAGSGEYHL